MPTNGRTRRTAHPSSPPLPRALAPEELRFICAPEQCAPPPQEELPLPAHAPGIFAQARALSALRLGLEIQSPGYNIFVTGYPGSGRMSAVEDVIGELRARSTVELRDRVYVNDFNDPTRPRLLTLPSGRGRALKEAMTELVESAESQLRALFDSEPFRVERDRVEKKFRTHEEQIFQDFQRELAADGLTLGMMGEGPEAATDVFVIVGEKPLPLSMLKVDHEARMAFAQARGLVLARGGDDEGEDEEEGGAEESEPSAERPPATAIAIAEPSPGDTIDTPLSIGDRLDAAVAAVERKYDVYRDRLAGIVRESRRMARNLEREVSEFETKRAHEVLADLITDVKDRFADSAIHSYLDQVEKHMLENLDLFTEEDEDEEEGESVALALLKASAEGKREGRRVYEVNVVLDTSDQALPPIVIEPNPTFINVFGAIEREGEIDSSRTDFRTIRAGSILRADNGYLVMYARDVLLEPGVWRTLARTLRSRRLEIQPPEAASHILPSALKPEPIDLELKVILIGDDDLYDLLAAYEEDFAKIFKIKAELDTVTDLTPDNIAQFVKIAQRIRVRESLLAFDNTGYAALVEQAVRRAGSKHKLSALFGEVADLMRETSYLAKQRGAETVDAAAVDAAVMARRHRHDLVDEHLGELLRREILLVSTAGERVGQVNGLAVFGVEPEVFGKPSRLTATVSAGRGGLVNIEREVHLSGPSHDKGMLILSGYLRRRFGRERPLALTASIAFEQSYGEVDGDSASMAELYCLLSAIAEVPIRQAVAITGSVNQLGDVQAVGGVNEKIEGFFRLAKERGLDGSHACVIPASDIQALMLDRDVIEACRDGKFSVYGVSHVDDAVPIVFGISAAELHERVMDQLARLGREGRREPAEIDRRVEGDGRRGKKTPKPPEEPRPRTPGS